MLRRVEVEQDRSAQLLPLFHILRKPSLYALSTIDDGKVERGEVEMLMAEK